MKLLKVCKLKRIWEKSVWKCFKGY